MVLELFFNCMTVQPKNKLIRILVLCLLWKFVIPKKYWICQWWKDWRNLWMWHCLQDFWMGCGEQRTLLHRYHSMYLTTVQWIWWCIHLICVTTNFIIAAFTTFFITIISKNFKIRISSPFLRLLINESFNLLIHIVKWFLLLPSLASYGRFLWL